MSLEFPFTLIDSPTFYIELDWTANEYLNYLNSWSAVQSYKDRNGKNPIDQVETDLRKLWGDSSKKVSWEIYLRVGLNN